MKTAAESKIKADENALQKSEVEWNINLAAGRGRYAISFPADRWSVQLTQWVSSFGYIVREDAALGKIKVSWRHFKETP